MFSSSSYRPCNFKEVESYILFITYIKSNDIGVTCVFCCWGPTDHTVVNFENFWRCPPMVLGLFLCTLRGGSSTLQHRYRGHGPTDVNFNHLEHDVPRLELPCSGSSSKAAYYMLLLGTICAGLALITSVPSVLFHGRRLLN